MHLLRSAIEKKPTSQMTLEEAKDVIKECLRLSYLRDCRASPNYHLAVVTKEGATVDAPAVIDTNWAVAHTIKGYE